MRFILPSPCLWSPCPRAWGMRGCLNLGSAVSCCETLSKFLHLSELYSQELQFSSESAEIMDVGYQIQIGASWTDMRWNPLSPQLSPLLQILVVTEPSLRLLFQGHAPVLVRTGKLHLGPLQRVLDLLDTSPDASGGKVKAASPKEAAMAK